MDLKRKANLKEIKVSAEVREIQADKYLLMNKRSLDVMKSTIVEHNEASKIFADFARAGKKRKKYHQLDGFTTPSPGSPKKHSSIEDMSRTDSEDAGQTSSSKELDDEIDNFLRSPNKRKPNQFVEKLKNLRPQMRYKLKRYTMIPATIQLIIKCRFEHLAHSFIIDPDDETYIQYEIFTPEELEEIRNTGAKGLPKMPDDLLKYIGSFRKKTAADLRMVLDTRQDWEGRNFDKTKHFDFDWIKNTVHSLLPEYEFETLQRKHLETWYNVHVWSLIDKSFSDLEGMDATRGESCSLSSSKRKNKRRIVKGIVKATRKALGRRGDLILRKGSYEYGASEVGKDYEGENGTKLLRERGIKSPKMFKDMLVDLDNFMKWKPKTHTMLRLTCYVIPYRVNKAQ